MDAIARYHAHLDTCVQCEQHPFDQCPIGYKLLVEAATGKKTMTEPDDLMRLATEKRVLVLHMCQLRGAGVIAQACGVTDAQLSDAAAGLLVPVEICQKVLSFLEKVDVANRP